MKAINHTMAYLLTLWAILSLMLTHSNLHF